MSRYQKGKTSLNFTEARYSEWQWHQLGHVQVCTLLQITTPAPHRSEFLQAGCPSCRPTNSVKALKTELQGDRYFFRIGADSTGATGNFAPVLTQEPGQTLRFAPVPFMAVL